MDGDACRAVIVYQTVSRLDCGKKTPVGVFTPYRTQDRIRDTRYEHRKEGKG